MVFLGGLFVTMALRLGRAADHRVPQDYPAKTAASAARGKKVQLRYRSRAGLPEGPMTADDFQDEKYGVLPKPCGPTRRKTPGDREDRWRYVDDARSGYSERRPNSRACTKTKGQILERPGALAR